jgi:hypothetical protein
MSVDNRRLQRIESDIENLRRRIQAFEAPPARIETVPGKKKRKHWRWLNPALMTLFTALLFGSSLLQWDVARKGITDTHRSFEIGTRAWVVPKEALVKPVTPDSPTHGTIADGNGIKDSRTPALATSLVNTGHSPALHVLSSFRTGVEMNLPGDDDTVLRPPVVSSFSDNGPGPSLYSNIQSRLPRIRRWRFHFGHNSVGYVGRVFNRVLIHQMARTGF